MKIIEPSVENITPSKYDLESIYKHIELCGRTCYKSEDKITNDSYKKFCEMLRDNNHFSCFEHGTIYLKYRNKEHSLWKGFYTINPYNKMFTLNGEIYITTNLRVIFENGLEDCLDYPCEPTRVHELRHTFRIICDRAVSHEFVRHRSLSFSQESQRYCNYSKGKYGSEVTFIKPHWASQEAINVYQHWITAMKNAEDCYFTLLDKGVKPQDARTVLPNSTKTELVVTGFTSDWKKFCDLRCSNAAHPDIRIIAEQIKKELNL